MADYLRLAVTLEKEELISDLPRVQINRSHVEQKA